MFKYFRPHTGSVQQFVTPKSGVYKIEVWGAQGGPSEYKGALGGYSEGTINVDNNFVFNICVGGMGRKSKIWPTIDNTDGGYNGGGYGTSGGGGATHIASTNRGLLKNYESYKNEVLIVAGGGGGCDSDGDNLLGIGGGIQGGTGSLYNTVPSLTPGGGGSQASGGTGIVGSFGQGGNSGVSGQDSSGAGGGGWYGGGGATSYAASGGGGSGHIGTGVTGSTIAGNQSFSAPSGGIEIGHGGDGYGIITMFP